MGDRAISGKTSEKRSENGHGQDWIGFLAFPPVLLPFFLLWGMFMGRGGAEPLSIPLTVSQVFAYVALCLAYLTLKKRAIRKGAQAASLMANGLSCLFLSYGMHAGDAPGWLGTGLLLAGAATALTLLAPAPVKRFAKAQPELFPASADKGELRSLLSAMKFPTAFLEYDDDGIERVIAANEPLAAMLGKNAEKMIGADFSTLLPPHEENATFRYADAEWVQHRTTKGKQALFMLSPAVHAASENPVAESGGILDPETGLFTPQYMKYKANADVQACKRYNKRLAVVLFRLVFDAVEVVVPSEEAKRTAVAAFGQMLSISVRACDTAYRMKEDEMLLFLPETAQSGSHAATVRIGENMRKLASVECVELAAARLLDVSVHFIGDEIGSVDQVVQEAYVAMRRKEKP